MKFNIILLLFVFTSSVYAIDTTKAFDATFNVYVIGIKVGEAKHSYSCDDNNCYLKTDTQANSFFKTFINENSVESNVFDKNFNLLEYQQHIEREIDGKIKDIFIDLNLVEDKVIYKQQNKIWVLKRPSFTLTSLAYGLGVLTAKYGEKLPKIYIQTKEGQEQLVIGKIEDKKIDIDYKNKLETIKYDLFSKKDGFNIYLAKSLSLFPVKVSFKERSKSYGVSIELKKIKFINETK